MATQKGFFIDYLTESLDPNYQFEEKRIYFGQYQRKAYNDCVLSLQRAGRLRAHGKMFS